MRLVLQVLSCRCTPATPRAKAQRTAPSLRHAASPCRSRTLLHFLAREVLRQHPGGASLRACLPSCKEAAKLGLAALHAELAEMRAGLAQVGLG